MCTSNRLISDRIDDEYHEQKLIQNLNNYYDFDHNIYLFDSTTDMNRYIDTTGTLSETPRSLFSFKNTDDGSLIGLEKLSGITSKTTLFVVIPGRGEMEKNLKLFSRVKEIQRLQLDMKIVVFLPPFVSTDDVSDLLRWSWKQGIDNIFVSIISGHPRGERSFEVFTFNSFGPF